MGKRLLRLTITLVGAAAFASSFSFTIFAATKPRTTSGNRRKVGVDIDKDETVVLPKVQTIDFGQDKSVDFFVPPDHLNRQLSHSERKRGKKIVTEDGAGDIIWPSSFALARLIAHCPNLVNGKDVLELGCGLGLVSAAACKHAKPDHVAVSDRDTNVLGMAYTSCTQLQRSRAPVSRTTLNWSDKSTWPKQNFDVLLASDVLYEKSSVLPLVNVLSNYLLAKGTGDDGALIMKRAIIVDPANQVNRDAFTYACYKAGLEVDETPFPGMENDFALLSITPLSL